MYLINCAEYHLDRLGGFGVAGMQSLNACYHVKAKSSLTLFGAAAMSVGWVQRRCFRAEHCEIVHARSENRTNPQFLPDGEGKHDIS